MRFGLDTTRFPTTALPSAAGGGAAGTLPRSTAPAGRQSISRESGGRKGVEGAHQVSFGVHADRYKLSSVTSATAELALRYGGRTTALALGRTSTDALWIQDAWRFAPRLKLTLGARQEAWRAYDGLNFRAPASNVSQPGLSAAKFSPKAALAWDTSTDWRVTASYGTAYRFTDRHRVVPGGDGRRRDLYAQPKFAARARVFRRTGARAANWGWA